MRLDHLLSKENGREGITPLRIGAFVVSRCSILREPPLELKKGEQDGGVAQLGEHLPCKQGVMGSNPIISTKRCERSERRARHECELLTTLNNGLIAQQVRARA